MTNIVRYFNKNTNGRDFAVGDVHGCFHLVEEKLEQIDFNPNTDRLFFVGDLVNRGEYSAEFTKWLNKPFVHSTRGNHEQMCLWFLSFQMTREALASIGGSWLTDKIPEEYYPTIRQAIENLPLAFEVETTEGLVVIAHASMCGSNWNQFKQSLIDEDPNSQLTPIRDTIMWDKSRFKSQLKININDIRALVVGHCKTNNPIRYGNTIYIDTGAYITNKLTFLELETLTYY